MAEHEHDPLLYTTGSLRKDTDQDRHFFVAAKRAGACIGLACVLSFFLVFVARLETRNSSMALQGNADSGMCAANGICGTMRGGQCVCMETKYSRHGIAWPAQQYSWIEHPVVEPMKDVYFSVEGSDAEVRNLGALAHPLNEASFNMPQDNMHWEVRSSAGVLVGVAKGAQITYIFEDLGTYTITPKETGTGSVLAPGLKVMVKYVRRELTTLLAEDRDALLDAMLVTYTVPTDDGILLYGADYLVSTDNRARV
jgi:hypothetical protein